MDTVHSAQVLGLVVGIVLPVLTGYVTKASWGGGVRAVLLAFLAAASGFGAELLDAVAREVSYDWKGGLLTALGAWVVAVATHFGYWKPTGASAAVVRSGVTDR